MRLTPWIKSGLALFVGMGLLAVILIVLLGWNWLRAPIERAVLANTGRVLALQGDLKVSLAWPSPRLSASSVRFANPVWATHTQMVTATAASVTVDLWQLLGGKLVFPEVRLENPTVMLEQDPMGRKSWLLDLDQQDESARVQIGLLTVDQGTLGFDDPVAKTSISANLSTIAVSGPELGLQSAVPQGNPAGLRFNATGRFKGLPLKATGTGGPVMALREETRPYELSLDAEVGQTSVRASGTITSLLKLVALDMRMTLKGQSLEELFPILGLAAPSTRAYAIEGHLTHAAKVWRFDKFSGKVGASDLAGSLHIDTGGQRPRLVADLTSKILDIEDLGPLIGAKVGSLTDARAAALSTPSSQSVTPPVGARSVNPTARMLPNVPFNSERWSSLDADVRLSAKTIRRPAAVPLENLVTHAVMKDSVLTLDPVNFGFAAGHLDGVVSLDGRQRPIVAKAQVKVKQIQLANLLPTVKLSQPSIGQINGEFRLTGRGDSVREMLALADGSVALLVGNGEISKLMMETAGLHLWEILQIRVTSDRPIKLRCGLAEFTVKQGVMKADALIFDTEVTTLTGVGTIDLGKEQLDLTFNQKTKNTSPLSLRSPIFLRGTFAQPQLGVNKGMVAMRALGALALGAVNPVLAFLPLVDPGPGQDSDCRSWVQNKAGVPGLPESKTSSHK